MMPDKKKTAVVGDSTGSLASKWVVNFTCQYCGHAWEQESFSDWQLCPKCDNRVYAEGKDINGETRRTPLTPVQARKLSWYRDERKWHEDIDKRRLLPNGDTAIVGRDGKVEEIRSKDEK